MTDKNDLYISTCPVGCLDLLRETDIVLPEGHLLSCPTCGQLISQCSKLRYEQSMSEFNTAEGTLPGKDAVKRHFQRTSRWLYAIAERLNKPNHDIRLLDVGCSTGSLLAVAGRLGFMAEGVEPAPLAVKTARASGLAVYQGTLEDVNFSSDTFDVVTMFEVIEHVENAFSLVKECHRIIKPGGLLVMGTANTDSWTVKIQKSRWEYFDISKHGGHVSFFNRKSVRILADRCGFGVELLKTYSVSFMERADSSVLIYRPLKILAELMNLPSKIFGKGHDMLVFLRKPK
ncbi:MAG TPA: class I SAM-dependent methyltransferase [Smithellaceae bacterium]|nr:class I SAM-dependent methyltransferase [Smithellaceae bacterium]HRS89401.1 class I SAM-dependent methyltransferase [Smithellaceae bacterium]HRV26189.1 class I SAM-dependent methyltransferase [Smithellaceae bacterium]